MATLPVEQVTQRNNVSLVGYTHSTADDAPSETAWHSTTTLPTTVVLTKDVAADQQDRQEIDDRLEAAANA